MDEGQDGLACHFVAAVPNGRLVVYNPGHFSTVADGSDWTNDGWAGYGDQRTVQALLDSGNGVLVSFMPHYRPDDIPPYGVDPHVAMFTSLHPAAGSPWKYFIQPITDSLNYLADATVAASVGFAPYTELDMLGLSGGGWTTVIVAAVDPRIRTSIQVAGSEPFDFWNGYASQDELSLPALYRVAAYRDLYVLGAAGQGRSQLQILNRHDDCCFCPGWAWGPADTWDESLRSYEAAVQARLAAMGDPGTFALEVDETSPRHQISRDALTRLILPRFSVSVSTR